MRCADVLVDCQHGKWRQWSPVYVVGSIDAVYHSLRRRGTPPSHFVFGAVIIDAGVVVFLDIQRPGLQAQVIDNVPPHFAHEFYDVASSETASPPSKRRCHR
jgi:hypothetical protein